VHSSQRYLTPFAIRPISSSNDDRPDTLDILSLLF
jgi:hypothetical protein